MQGNLLSGENPSVAFETPHIFYFLFMKRECGMAQAFRINMLFLYYEELTSKVTSPLILAPIQQYLQPTCETAKTSSFRLPDHPIGPLPDVLKIGVSGANVKILSLHRFQAGLWSRRSISSPSRDSCSSPGGATTRDRGSSHRHAAARFRHRFCPQISRLRAVFGGQGPPICRQIKDRVIGSQRLPLYGALCCQWRRSRSRPPVDASI